jgi:tetratricopeptide (TPR) repeat protein
MLLLIPLGAGQAWALNSTSVLNAEDWRITLDTSERFAQHAYNDPFIHYKDQTAHYDFSSSIHYGLIAGTELLLQYPIVSLDQATVNNQMPSQKPAFFEDLACGARFQLLDNSGITPAFILETRLNIPTGTSRFYDYLNYLGNSQYALTSAEQRILQCTLGGLISTYLDPVEFHLGFHYQTPGNSIFEVNGMNHTVDFGQTIDAAAGITVFFSKSFSLGLEGQMISHAASEWRRNGQNVLDAPYGSPGALSLQTHALGGVFLHNALEAYIGPALTLTPRAGFDITLLCLAGLTPDSETVRLQLNFSRLFKHARLRPKKFRAAGKRAVHEPGNLSRRQQSDEIRNLQDQADDALQRDDLAGAVTAWREILKHNPRHRKALAAMREYQDDIQESIKQLYLDGMQDYVQNDYASAIAQWQEALRYNPNDAKVLSSIAQTQKKLESIRQIKRQTPTPNTPPQGTGMPVPCP